MTTLTAGLSQFAFLIAMSLLLLGTRVSMAQTRTCDALSGDKKQLAASVMNERRLYNCCDGTISHCLKEGKCTLATRLANQETAIERLVDQSKDAWRVAEQGVWVFSVFVVKQRPLMVRCSRACSWRFPEICEKPPGIIVVMPSASVSCTG